MVISQSDFKQSDNTYLQTQWQCSQTEDEKDTSQIVEKIIQMASILVKDKPECSFHGVEIHIFPPQMTLQSQELSEV